MNERSMGLVGLASVVANTYIRYCSMIPGTVQYKERRPLLSLCVCKKWSSQSQMDSRQQQKKKSVTFSNVAVQVMTFSV